jgi:hypothetical protein
MPINQFYTNLVQNAPILKNQFYVTLAGDFPAYGGNYQLDMGEIDTAFHFYARGAKLPRYTMSTAELSFHGQKFTIPTIVKFEHEYSINVYCDKKLMLWKYFKNWIDEMSQFSQSGGVEMDGILRGVRGVPNTQLWLQLLTDPMFNSPTQSAPGDDTIVDTYIMEGMFPTSVGELEWSHDNAEVQTFQLGFSYQYFYPKSEGDSLLT